MSTQTTEPPKYTKKDFVSDQQIRWCPGCGDYAIVNGIQQAFSEMGVPKEQFVMISGIGCAARVPYYVDTYGFHTIHGRAPAIATGLKIARPELEVWVTGGDGDMLSIGGNHLIHALRRNISIKIMCWNNRIYGLTKGQASPTSEFGKKTYSTPMGSLDRPVNPISVALAAEATFVARTVDVFNAHMKEVLHAAHKHEGSVFIEMMQNCVISNKDAWAAESDGGNGDENALRVEAGKPMVFGKDREKGLRLNGLKPEVVELGNGVTEKDLLVHDEADERLGYLLSRLGPPDFPMPMGIFHRANFPAYEKGVHGQVDEARKKKGEGELLKLIHAGDTWEVT